MALSAGGADQGLAAVNLGDWQSAGGHFSHTGHRIFFREEGEGDILLCIHGFPTASWDWYRIWDGLRARYRVIACDMIGFGFSDKPAGYHYSIEDQADIQEELLESVGVDGVHVLAHDYGVSVAQELLARYEDRRRGGQGGPRLRSICFLNGGLFPETHRARFVQKVLASPAGWMLSRMFNRRSFERSFSAVFGPDTQPSSEELADFWNLVAHNDGNRIMHKLIAYMADRIRNRERWVGAMQATEVPLRLVNGPEDPVSGGHMVQRYRELIPHPDVVVLDGIGHYPQVEAPKPVLEAALEFFKTVENGAG